ncbi:MAG: hypothetical protein Q8N39_01830 [Pelolinea sp.]|nr:hypothetical protein [Pelolinea sp.]
MSILDDLKLPLRKIILESPLHGLLSEDHALVSFTDHLTGKRLSFSVPYQKEHRIIRVICPKGDKYWKKFTFGSPLRITIRGIHYQGWAEIIDNPEEAQKEWRALIKTKLELVTQLNIPLSEEGEPDMKEILTKTSSLDILRIEVSGK